MPVSAATSAFRTTFLCSKKWRMEQRRQTLTPTRGRDRQTNTKKEPPKHQMAGASQGCGGHWEEPHRPLAAPKPYPALRHAPLHSTASAPAPAPAPAPARPSRPARGLGSLSRKLQGSVRTTQGWRPSLARFWQPLSRAETATHGARSRQFQTAAGQTRRGRIARWGM
ncbi:hypothetical protein CSHISOI_10872 [Colletotrichum shisoi]|uniref:Uncharacterized protein n=1 Tax=Colletotrichum shisoi TaxID=2078593 RepID=A0A5Q4BCU2_9PEZI|nr:hypothetical protein CSHISOI_10872 [Colletotrichum shisoi]